MNDRNLAAVEALATAVPTLATLRDVPCSDTPLGRAIATKQLDIAHVLIENGADVNSCGEHESSPLYQAVFCAKDYDLTLKLLKYGADPNMVSHEKS